MRHVCGHAAVSRAAWAEAGAARRADSRRGRAHADSGRLGADRWRISGPAGAAALLGLEPTTLESRIKKLGLQRPN